MSAGALAVVGVAIGIAIAVNGGGDGQGAQDSERSGACEALSGPAGERLAACLDEVDGGHLSPAAVRRAENLLTSAQDTMLVAGGRLDIRGTQELLADVPDLQDVLLADDEEAAASTLRDEGYRAVAVHRDLTRALDRDDAVLARMAYHDYLEWFELQWVADGVLLYTVRPTPMRLPDSVGSQLVAGLRARLEGAVPEPIDPWEPRAIEVIASIRLQGQTLAMRYSGGDAIEGVLDDLAVKLRTRWERQVETQGMGPLGDRLPEARIEVHVFQERARVDPRGDTALSGLWEMGIDGAILTERRDSGDERFGYMPGSEATARALRSPEDFLRFTAREHGWGDLRPWVRDGVGLSVFRTDHFMEAQPGGGAVVSMMRGMPTVSMDELTDENLRQMLIDGGEWWVRNQHPDGSFVYKYWPEQHRFSTEYNEVRHILAARDLADTWRYRPDPRYLEGARRAMDWLLQYEIRDTDPVHPTLPHPGDGELLFRYPLQIQNEKTPSQKLGTVALALLGWVEWAKATDDGSEDDRILRMARYTLSQLNDDGSFEAYNVPPDHPASRQVNDIVPGEAALALGMVAEYFDDHSWIEFFPDFLDYYEPWFRERAADKDPYGRWPHGTYGNERRLELVQFGPWAVMASKQYHNLTGDERAAAFGLEIADWMIEHYQWSSDRSPWPDYVGGYYKIPGELPAMQAFVYSEATAAAYAIASSFVPERAEVYDRATRETLRFLRVMQYDDLDSYYAPRLDLVHGGIKYAMNEAKIRIDYVGHALSTLSQYLDARVQAGATLAPLEVGGPG